MEEGDSYFNIYIPKTFTKLQCSLPAIPDKHNSGIMDDNFTAAWNILKYIRFIIFIRHMSSAEINITVENKLNLIERLLFMLNVYIFIEAFYIVHYMNDMKY